jgi:hypothetical protein
MRYKIENFNSGICFFFRISGLNTTLLLLPSHIYSPVSLCEAVQEFASNKISCRNENNCGVTAKNHNLLTITQVNSLTVVK